MPTDGDRVGAFRRFLSGLAHDADANRLVADIADLHVRNNTFPGEVFMELSADALDRPDSTHGTASTIASSSTQSWRRSHSAARSIGASSTPSSPRSQFTADCSRISWTRSRTGSTGTGSTPPSQPSRSFAPARSAPTNPSNDSPSNSPLATPSRSIDRLRRADTSRPPRPHRGRLVAGDWGRGMSGGYAAL